MMLSIIELFFSYLGFPSQTFTNYRTAGEERGHFFNCSLPFLPASQTLRHQPDNYCREIISAHTKSSVYFSHSRTFMNSARVCWIIKRTVFNVQICLTTVGDMNTTNFKGLMKNQDIKGSFSKFRQFLYLSVYLQLLLNMLYCTQNCKFYYFLETKICFAKKNCSISSQACVFILSKNQ